MTLPLEGHADKIAAAAQGSPEWLRQRTGWVTASRFADVMDFRKDGKPGARREAYLYETVISRLTGFAPERFVSDAMQWGTDHDPAARMAYETATGRIVETVGFMRHPSVKMCGGSVDGLVDNDGMVEIKCPTTKTHLVTVMSQVCEHLPQIQGYMWITGRQWCDFVSFDPRLPDGLNLYIQRIPRDDAYILTLGAHVLNFIDQALEMYDELAKKIVVPEFPTNEIALEP